MFSTILPLLADSKCYSMCYTMGSEEASRRSEGGLRALVFGAHKRTVPPVTSGTVTIFVSIE